MSVDDGTPGFRRRLNLVALVVVVAAIVVARACGSRGASAPAATPAATLPDPGTSISKDHGASTGKPPGG